MMLCVLGAVLFLGGCGNHHKDCSCCHHHKDVSFAKDTLYKIVKPEEYITQDDGVYLTATSLDLSSGFLHLSWGHQVIKTLQSFFRSADEVWVLELDKSVIVQAGGDIRLESSKPGGDVFPHAYGIPGIPTQAITTIHKLIRAHGNKWHEKH